MADTPTPCPVRLQLSRRRGFNLQALSRATNGLPARAVARPSRWGNPWIVGTPGRIHIHHAENGEAVTLMCDWYHDQAPPCGPLTPDLAREAHAWWLNGVDPKSELPTCADPRFLDLAAATLDDKRRALLAAMATLAGHNLACWCPLDAACHADTLIEMANREGHGT